MRKNQSSNVNFLLNVIHLTHVRNVYRAVKKGLQDISDIKRERRKLPKSTLGLWRYNNSLRKERIFEEPLLPGEFVFHVMDIHCFPIRGNDMY